MLWKLDLTTPTHLIRWQFYLFLIHVGRNISVATASLVSNFLKPFPLYTITFTNREVSPECPDPSIDPPSILALHFFLTLLPQIPSLFLRL